MANPYCTINQLASLYDSRSMKQLSNDDNSREANQANIQLVLDIQASELESHLDGRYDLPTIQALNPMPGILTKWVACTAAGRMWGRRADKPKGLSQDEDWAATWIQQLQNGLVNIPGVARLNQPCLVASDFKDGRSRWDWIFGQRPSRTGPSHGR